MANIRVVETEDKEVYINRNDLLLIFNERMKTLPQEIEALRTEKESSIVNPDGTKNIVPPSEEDLLESIRHEGMLRMLQGIINIIMPDKA